MPVTFGYRPLRGPAVAVVVTLAIVIAVDVFGLVSSLVALNELRGYPGDMAWDDPAIAGLSLRAFVVFVIQALALLAAGIAFFVWFYRAYRNVGPLWPRHRPQRQSGWAIAAWFVPIVSWFFPYMMSREIWRAGDPDAPPDSGEEKSRPLDPILIIWWLMWCFALVSTNFSWGSTAEAEDVAALISATRVDAAALILWIAAAVLAILVVRTATQRMEHRAEQLFGASPPG